MNGNIIKQRIKQAESLEKKINSIFNDLEKIPSFNGKAKFMDKVIEARNLSHLLTSNLDLDAKKLN